MPGCREISRSYLRCGGRVLACSSEDIQVIMVLQGDLGEKKGIWGGNGGGRKERRREGGSSERGRRGGRGGGW